MSMTTALSGLIAAQSDISTTSHNIANVGTNAFRKSRAEFADDYYTNPMNASRTVVGSGTHLSRVAVQFGQGNFVATGQTLDLAIQGAGFFVVAPTADENGNANEIAYTRSGSFALNAEGRVADTSGRPLMTYPVANDGTTLQMTEAALQPVNIPLSYGTTTATSQVNLNLRMPSGEDVLGAQDAVPPTNAFATDDPTSYAFSTPIPMTDAEGNAVEARAFYVRTASPDAFSTITEYEMHLIVDGNEIPPAAGAALQFDAAGDLDPLTTELVFGTAPDEYTMNMESSTLAADVFAVREATENGETPLGLSNLEVDSEGVIWGSYGTEARLALGRVALANFINPQGLVQRGNATFQEASDSGRPEFSAGGEMGMGNLQAGMLERSNVDLTEELVNLITAQRNYQANAKAMETSSSLMQTIMNIRS